MDLIGFLERPVMVLLSDGRLLVGVCKGFDPHANLVLSHSHERLFQDKMPVRVVDVGSVVVRGECVAVVGELDGERDGGVEWGGMMLAPLPAIPY
jgi:U6 snRNA-associated Sm-like protein LSm8